MNGWNVWGGSGGHPPPDLETVDFVKFRDGTIWEGAKLRWEPKSVWLHPEMPLDGDIVAYRLKPSAVPLAPPPMPPYTPNEVRRCAEALESIALSLTMLLQLAQAEAQR